MTQLHLIIKSVKSQVNKVIYFRNDYIDLLDDDNSRTYILGRHILPYVPAPVVPEMSSPDRKGMSIDHFSIGYISIIRV